MTRDRRRVVITGMGAVTPLGNTRDAFWRALLAGQSGVAKVTAFDAAAAGLRAQIAAEVKDFDADALIGRRDARRMDRYAQFAFVAAREAIEDAKFPDDKELREQTGVVVASGIGGIITIQDNVTKARATGTAGRITPFFIPMLMSNAAPAQISMCYGFRGPTYAVSSACASSNDAFAVSYDLIVEGKARAMITGGAEATITDVAMGGFDSMKALSTRNDEPTKASRPFDKERDGFVLAEGSAIFVLEELELATARGARIYAELLGYGQSADAYDLVAVDPAGSGVELALRRAFERSGVAPASVDYVNAHATSTPIGDPAESQALGRMLGVDGHAFAVSSTKSMHGHALGAAGALEGVATVLTIKNGIIPPTINYEYPDPECTLDYVPNIARRAEVNVALSSSFGFGGHNSVAVFGKYKN
ncbi:MAG: beta-ketoacyl-ACP synthase II [Candidatus Eremiobacteraeota bacterium]|nr:beta-ketoacyl-ACP synthase II [Candidatus Eremiobacteraeota bacterium]MBC5804100.1 beta-ketoacyl-ACP synthase II [Candidatus Eremiobacteraeota bacterium]